MLIFLCLICMQLFHLILPNIWRIILRLNAVLRSFLCFTTVTDAGYIKTLIVVHQSKQKHRNDTFVLFFVNILFLTNDTMTTMVLVSTRQCQCQIQSQKTPCAVCHSSFNQGAYKVWVKQWAQRNSGLVEEMGKRAIDRVGERWNEVYDSSLNSFAVNVHLYL